MDHDQSVNSIIISIEQDICLNENSTAKILPTRHSPSVQQWLPLQGTPRGPRAQLYCKSSTRAWAAGTHYIWDEVMPHWEHMERHNGDVPGRLASLGGRPAREVVDELGNTIS